MKLKDFIDFDFISEKSKGLWANIHAKRKRGENPAKKGSKAYKKAKAAGMSVPQYANKVLKKGSDASTRTKKQASLAKTLRSFHADGGLTKVSGYKPVLGNNKFGYPSGGVPVTSYRGGGIALRGLGRAFTKK